MPHAEPSNTSVPPAPRLGSVAPQNMVSGASGWARPRDPAPGSSPSSTSFDETAIAIPHDHEQPESPESLLAFQAALMGQPPVMDGWSIAADFQPLSLVSGDFWDMRLVDGRIRIAQGDISGHGISAALVMAVARKLFEQSARRDPRSSMIWVNQEIHGQTAGKYLTACILDIDPQSGQAVYVRAGHTPALLHQDGIVEQIRPKGLAVGMRGDQAFAAALEEYRFVMKPGDTCILYTDGITESMNRSHEEFGADLVASILAQHAAEPTVRVVEHIRNSARHFRGKTIADDDEMVIAIRRLRSGDHHV